MKRTVDFMMVTGFKPSKLHVVDANMYATKSRATIVAERMGLELD